MKWLAGGIVPDKRREGEREGDEKQGIVQIHAGHEQRKAEQWKKKEHMYENQSQATEELARRDENERKVKEIEAFSKQY